MRPLWVLPAGLMAPCHLCSPGILPFRALLPGVWARDVVFKGSWVGRGERKPVDKDLEVSGDIKGLKVISLQGACPLMPWGGLKVFSNPDQKADSVVKFGDPLNLVGRKNHAQDEGKEV